MNESESKEEPAPDVCQFARTTLSKRIAKMLSEAEGAESGKTSEPIHQMRVWSRRARAAHDLFHACFPTKEYQSLGRQLKNVTKALGAARDLDVMIDALRHEAELLPQNECAGIDGFVAHLKRRRRSRQKAVERAMKHLKTGRFAERFAALLQIPAATLEPGPAKRPGKPVRRKRIEEADEL